MLDVIAQYSCVEPGISNLRKSKIAAAVGKCRRTVIRTCNRLEEIGIIAQYKRMRQTGDRRQKSNKIVILHAVEQPQAADVTAECHTEEAPEINSKSSNTIATEGALKRSLPAQLYAALSPYFNDADMYRVVGLLYRAKASVDRAITFENHASAFIDVFKSVVFNYKRGKVRSMAHSGHGDQTQAGV